MWTDHGMRLLAVSAVLAVLALVALCLALLIRTNQNQEFKEQAEANCRQLNLVKSALRAQLDDEERTVLDARPRTADQVSAITEFYARQRARFADDHCPGSDQPTEGG